MRPTAPVPGSADVLPLSRGPRTTTRLFDVLAVTVIASFATSLFWNAIGFIARQGYDFSSARTLMLYVAMGVVYVVGAWSAAATLRRLSRVSSPRHLVLLLLIGQFVACILPILAGSEVLFWGAGLLASYVSSLLWPIVHAYLSSGRHGSAMRRGIGFFNVTWMIAVAVPLLSGGHILERAPRLLLAIVGVLTLFALIPAWRFALRPAEHGGDEGAAHVPVSYVPLSRSARRLLPLSYLFVGAVSPLAPYRCEDLEIPVTTAAPLTATWMITRVVVVVLMLGTHAWAGRWMLLGAAGAAMTGGFAIFALATHPWHLYVGLGILGMGLGAIYHAALYYGMAVGRAEVDAGGRHEALIGGGYVLGPAAALLGAWVSGWLPTIREDVGTLIAVSLLAFVGLMLAARPWWMARRGIAF